jgi:methionyl-tRNA synthetase
VNKDLADTFGNLVNRCLAFAASTFGPTVPTGGTIGPTERELAHKLGQGLAQLRAHHEALNLRKAANEVRTIWKIANAYLAETAPWSVVTHDRERAAAITRTGINLVRVAALAAWPFIPATAAIVLHSLGDEADPASWVEDGGLAISTVAAGRPFRVPPILFRKIAAADLSST